MTAARIDDVAEDRKERKEGRWQNGKEWGKPAVQHSLNYSSISVWVAAYEENRG